VPSSRSDRTATTAGVSDRLHALWHTSATTGMRRGELVALDWNRDMHLDDDCACRPAPAGSHLVINWAIRELGGEDLEELSDLDPVDVERGWMWAPPKTESGYRAISLDKGTVTALTEWRARQRAERLALGSGWRGVTGPSGQPSDLVFSRPDGSPILPSDASETFRRRTERFGHPLSIHGLRHTWATLALEAGVHPKVVQKRLGHSKVQTTLDLYTHVRSVVDAEAAQTVADLIAGAPLPAAAPSPRRAAAPTAAVIPLH
jgi:integrase